MGLFDSYFDPEQFQDSGGLVGRLLSLQQQQGQYQPGGGFDPQVSTGNGQTSSAPQSVPLPMARPISAVNGAAASPQTPDDGPRRTIAIGDYQMPQFGSADASQAPPQQPAIGDRLSAGFQNWAHTPLGNPFAALANGISGLSSGKRTDPAGVPLSQAPSEALAQPPDLGDRLSVGLQSSAHTTVGNPLAALANGISGFGSGQRSDPAAVAQQILRSPIDADGNPQLDLHAQFQALRPLLGDRNATLAIVHPEVGRSLIAQALAGQTMPASTGDADPAGNGQVGRGRETNPTAGGQPPSLAPAIPSSKPPSYAARAIRGAPGSRPNIPGVPARSAVEAEMRKRGFLK